MEVEPQEEREPGTTQVVEELEQAGPVAWERADPVEVAALAQVGSVEAVQPPAQGALEAQAGQARELVRERARGAHSLVQREAQVKVLGVPGAVVRME